MILNWRFSSPDLQSCVWSILFWIAWQSVIRNSPLLGKQFFLHQAFYQPVLQTQHCKFYLHSRNVEFTSMSAPVSVRRHNPPLWFHQWGSTLNSSILDFTSSPGVLSFPSISHTFAKIFAVQKYPAVLQMGEALNYYYNYEFY